MVSVLLPATGVGWGWCELVFTVLLLANRVLWSSDAETCLVDSYAVAALPSGLLVNGCCLGQAPPHHCASKAAAFLVDAYSTVHTRVHTCTHVFVRVHACFHLFARFRTWLREARTGFAAGLHT